MSLTTLSGPVLRACSFHSGGANFAFGDGSVRLINSDINVREFAKLVTRAGGELTPPTE